MDELMSLRLYEAFLAGFMSSEEGKNGEYFKGSGEEIRKEIGKMFEEFLKKSGWK